MKRFDIGDEVRVDIPDETDPDHHLHGAQGRVTDIAEDQAEKVTGDERDRYRYFVTISDGQTVALRWRDLRPL
jgi:ribosomal protein L21E